MNGLKKIETNTIDLIITSPPYNLGNNHHTGLKKHTPYNDDMKESEYQKWQVEFLNECSRVLKNDGSMLYNHKNRISKGLQITPYEWILKSNLLVKQEVVWINRSQNFDKIRFYPWTERIYWLVNDRSTKLSNVLNKHDVFDWNEWRPVGTRNKHTRAFPEKLVVDLLRVFPNAKFVLDPFMGSGTTAVACILENRNFLGFEINEDFIKLSRERVRSIKNAKTFNQNDD